MNRDNAHLARARQLDEMDELAPFRRFFHLPPGVVYLDGNSLGPLSVQAESSILNILQEWRTLGIRGWLDAKPPWFHMAEKIAELMAPLVGAAPDEIAIANSTTINLHQLLATLYRADDRRTKILADPLNFPSDLYALQSHLGLRGRDRRSDLVFVPSRNDCTLADEDIANALTEEVQMAVLPAVLYKSGQLLDMAAIARQAREKNILIGFDCSHSIGVVPHELDDWGVDFAFWCTYKYLNSGPGGVAGLYLNRRHFGRTAGLAGWFGSDKAHQFDMLPEFTPAAGAGSLQVGTPQILSMAPLLGTLELMRDARIERIRVKSLRLTEFLMELVRIELAAHGFRIITPTEPRRRGGHVALHHPESLRISKALKSAKVISDFRPPSIIRLAPVPLYNSFQDCYEVVARLKTIIESRSYERFSADREAIT